MALEQVNSVADYNQYFVKPKKSCSGRTIMSSLGVMTTGAALGYLLNEPEKLKFDNSEILAPFKQKFNISKINEEFSTGLKAVDKQNVALKNKYISRFLPLALILLSVIGGFYGLGAAMDNSNYNRKIKRATKQAIKAQEQELNLREKFNTKA